MSARVLRQGLWMHSGKFSAGAQRPTTMPDSHEDLKNTCKLRKGGEVGIGVGRRGRDHRFSDFEMS